MLTIRMGPRPGVTTDLGAAMMGNRAGCREQCVYYMGKNHQRCLIRANITVKRARNSRLPDKWLGHGEESLHQAQNATCSNKAYGQFRCGKCRFTFHGSMRAREDMRPREQGTRPPVLFVSKEHRPSNRRRWAPAEASTSQQGLHVYMILCSSSWWQLFVRISAILVFLIPSVA